MTRALTLLAALALTAGLTGCDTIFGSDSPDEYRADLAALNGSGVSGTATFTTEDGGDFTADVDASGLADGQVHPQHIHAAGACPTSAADTSGDGLVDLGEGAAAYGSPIIPLDDDLADGMANTFPSGASINYSQSTALGTIQDLLDPESLALDTRTVVLHGAHVLNGQIVAGGTTNAQYVATLPVACGPIELTSGSDDGGVY